MNITSRRVAAIKARRKVRADRCELFDRIASDCWNETDGHIGSARAMAIKKMKAEGVGFTEWIVLVYYMIKIWKLLRDTSVMKTTPGKIGDLG